MKPKRKRKMKTPNQKSKIQNNKSNESIENVFFLSVFLSFFILFFLYIYIEGTNWNTDAERGAWWCRRKKEASLVASSAWGTWEPTREDRANKKTDAEEKESKGGKINRRLMTGAHYDGRDPRRRGRQSEARVEVEVEEKTWSICCSLTALFKGKSDLRAF